MMQRVTKPKIVVVHVLNPQVRQFETAFPVSRAHINHFPFPLQEGPGWGTERELTAIGPIAETLLRNLNEIAGIKEVFTNLYSITVTKGRAFDWEDIEPPVLEALVKVYNANHETSLVLANFTIESDKDNRGGVTPPSLALDDEREFDNLP